MDIPYNSCLMTDLSLLRENVRSIRRTLSPETEIIPVLKDDAYGLGLVPVAKALEEENCVRRFAVAHVSEGLLLREVGIRRNILVIGLPLPSQLVPAAEAGLTLTVGRLGLIPLLKRMERPIRVQLKLDVGLHRIGIRPEELDDLIRELRDAGEQVIVEGVFSHFSAAKEDGAYRAQYEAFLRGVRYLEDAGVPVPMRHICDSAASELFPQSALDAVSLGRRLYMDHPTMPTGTVREVVTWRAYISDIRERSAGDALGYGGDYILPKNARIAALSVGYGDGLDPRMGKLRAPVLIGGKRCPVLAVFMDQALVDVSDTDCEIGDAVTVFGYDGKGGFLSSQELALLIGANEGCGLTAALSSRVKRVYTEG